MTTPKTKKWPISRPPAKNKANPKKPDPKWAAFTEHLREIRTRLLWVVGFFLIAASAAFPFRDSLMQTLMAPLGNYQLYYLTPAGGFSFIIKVCTYAGLLASVPVLIYHFYKFIEPLMTKRRLNVIRYVVWSSILALGGTFFAYFVILPTALHFLTNLDAGGLQAMLTADSYLSFVIIYIIGVAILFQIPLVLLMINAIKKLSLRKLFAAQRYVAIGSLLIAAIISPTMDIMNQLLLAVPVIVMFQLGIGLVWLKQWSAKRKPAPQPEAIEE